jgi:hypothetical protein
MCCESDYGSPNNGECSCKDCASGCKITLYGFVILLALVAFIMSIVSYDARANTVSRVCLRGKGWWPADPRIPPWAQNGIDKELGILKANVSALLNFTRAVRGCLANAEYDVCYLNYLG